MMGDGGHQCRYIIEKWIVVIEGGIPIPMKDIRRPTAKEIAITPGLDHADHLHEGKIDVEGLDDLAME